LTKRRFVTQIGSEAGMLDNSQMMGVLSGLFAVTVFLIAHFLAVYIAFSSGAGIGGGLLTLILPVLAEIYWIAHLRESTGSFLNAITFLSAGSLVLVFLTYAFSIASKEAA
jgi:hypothetical protein